MCWAWTRGLSEQGPGVSSLRTGSSGLHFHLRLSLRSKVPPSASSPEEGVWPPARSLGAGFLFLTISVSPVRRACANHRHADGSLPR